jgi:hypothetical protein
MMPTSIDQKSPKKQKNCLSNLPKFDFDEWNTLYKKDPEAFEKKRLECLNQCIMDAPLKYQKRLNGLMFHVNAIRQLEKNPMQTCIKMSSMMMQSLNDMRDFLNELHALMDGKKQPGPPPISAEILPFLKPTPQEDI